MIRQLLYAAVLIAFGAVGAWALRPGAPAPSSPPGTQWTCGMHPTVIRDAPGPCPICGMDLVERREGGHVHENGQLYIDPATRQAIGVRTSLVQRGPLTRRLRVLARVVPDERREALVTSKYAGWVEKIFVNESGQAIRRGEPLLSLYSPQVYAGQEELLLAARQGNRTLIASAQERLRSWDMTEGQLKRLLQRRKPRRAVTRYSPTAGHVLKKYIVDGQYVAAGQPLYQIVDLSRVWVEAEVYEYDVAWIDLGQKAELSLAYTPGRAFSGQVVFVYPAVDETSRTVRVRLEFDNPDLVMRPGMFGSVRLAGQHSSDVVHVSDTAVLRSGRRDVVFVALGDGHFEAREVVVGRTADDGRVEVRSGLFAGERVVTQSQFLLDSESRLREAIAKMKSEPGPASRPATQPAVPIGGAGTQPALRPATQPSSRPARPRPDSP